MKRKARRWIRWAVIWPRDPDYLELWKLEVNAHRCCLSGHGQEVIRVEVLEILPKRRKK